VLPRRTNRPRLKTKSLYAVAGRAGNDVMLKFANVSPDPQATTIDLDGLSGASAAGRASVTTLTSGGPDGENSLDNPAKVSPKNTAVDVNGTTLPYTFPANSVTVIRVPTKS
jgi:alpha-N-arabinofuranosidase